MCQHNFIHLFTCVYHFPDEDDYRRLTFDDNLVTISDTGKELGEFHVSVRRTRHEEKDCFLIHANSHGTIDNVPCGTSVLAYVTPHLETLEQQHHEYVKVLKENAISSVIIMYMYAGSSGTSFISLSWLFNNNNTLHYSSNACK